MRRTDRAAQTVVRHDGETLGLGLGQFRVRDHEGKRGRGRRAALHAQLERPSGYAVGQTAASELAVELVRGCPKVRAVADGGSADGIYDCERSHDEAGWSNGTSRTEPAAQIGRSGAETGSGAP